MVSMQTSKRGIRKKIRRVRGSELLKRNSPAEMPS